MKYLFIALVSLTTLNAIAQNPDLVDVIIDDRPAKLNTKTGKFTYTGKAPKKTTSKAETTTKTNPTTNSNTHTVVKGDTFYSIANYYGISIAQLKALNGIDNNNIIIGQELKIGYSNRLIAEDSEHIVVKGETLYSISKRNNLSVSKLKTLNQLSTNVIRIGQVLKLK